MRLSLQLSPAVLVLLGCVAQPALSSPPGYEGDVRKYNLAHGRVVFSEHCVRCHEGGRRGAPVLGDTLDWRDRVEQSLPMLIQHALDGHGDMPPRGDTKLNDQDIASAVAYVVNRTRVLAALEGESLDSPAAGLAENDPPNNAVLEVFLLLLGKDRWR
jgi:cytochrome c5